MNQHFFTDVALRKLEELADDPCLPEVPDTAEFGFRVGAIFIIFACSLLGVLSTLTGDLLPPYVLIFASTIGTGILLACALIHLLLPAVESLTSPCVSKAFNTTYPAYAYLFCMLAFLVAQFFQNWLSSPFRSWANTPHTHGIQATNTENVIELGESETSHKHENPMHENESSDKDLKTALVPTNYYASVQEAVSTEMVFLLHSVIIGITTGLAMNEELRSLVVALSFHQFFEGVSLGARLYNAKLGVLPNAFLTLIFSVAASVGIAVSVGMLTSNPPNINGKTFLLTQGSLDGITAGFLLQIAASKLIVDFPRDCLKEEINGNTLQHLGLYVAVSLGAGFMAFIGKYL